MSRRIISILIAVLIAVSLVAVSVGAETERTPVRTSDYYGRYALSQMPNSTALLYAYDQIASAAARNSASVTVYDGYHPISIDELQTVYDAYRRDYVEHFWIGSQYSYSYNAQTVVEFHLTYLTASSAESNALKAQLEAAADAIFAEITPDMSDFEVELLFHDRIVDAVTYAESANCRNAYGALVEGVSVCEGYAEAFQYLCRRAGIEAFTANNDDHEWSYVKLDGSWYHVDVTWDDQPGISHLYFNRTTDFMLRDHTIEATAYALPSCVSTEAFYYNVMPGRLSSFSADVVGRMLAEGDLKTHVYAENAVDSFMSWYQNNIRDIAAAAGVAGGFSYSRLPFGDEVYLTITASIVNVVDLSVAPTAIELDCGETASLAVSVIPASATNASYTFASSDERVATVSADGTVTAVGAGSATITVTAADGVHTASCTVTVNALTVYGDANGDGSVDSKDVTLLRRFLANYDEDTGLSSVEVASGADANGDESLDSKDVTLLRRYLANYDEDTGVSTVVLGPSH